jgi:Holliday junction resolvase-like predicted endonuclease
MPPNQQNRLMEFEELLAKALHKMGWEVERSSRSEGEADIVARHGNSIYVFELKASSESRKDRAIPLISQAILEAKRAAAQVSAGATPVAVLASDHVSNSLAEHIKEFAFRNAPKVGVGIIDAGGFRRFAGHGLEVLNSERSRVIEGPPKEVSPGNLFSDLNQWMLKILLSTNIPDSLLSAPRGHYENVSQLAAAAGVSTMSAFRFVRQLSEEGFLDEVNGMRLVRTEELLERWLRASHSRMHETPARWILSGEKDTFHAALRSHASRMRSSAPHSKTDQLRRGKPRLCLALFAAAEVLGFKFVHGTQPHLYIEWLDRKVLRELGLSLEVADHHADVFVRVPKNTEAVFRAAVERDGVPATDILQVWLDVSNHPARGKDQSDLLRKRVFSQILNKANA